MVEIATNHVESDFISSEDEENFKTQIVLRKEFEKKVVVIPYASASDADRAQYPEPTNQEIHDYWAGMMP
ncbi:MAG: hypothetical protein WCJ24_02060 [Candidatus Saccharibacteria bacterium]